MISVCRSSCWKRLSPSPPDLKDTFQEGGISARGPEMRFPSRGLCQMLPIHLFMSLISFSSVSWLWKTFERRSIRRITIVEELKNAVNKAFKTLTTLISGVVGDVWAEMADAVLSPKIRIRETCNYIQLGQKHYYLKSGAFKEIVELQQVCACFGNSFLSAVWELTSVGMWVFHLTYLIFTCL